MASPNIGNWVTVRPRGNKILVISPTRAEGRIKLFGSTMPTSARPLNQRGSGEHQLVLYPKSGESGIIAICVCTFGDTTGGGKEVITLPAFLLVQWKKNHEGQPFPFIDLQDQWFPEDRIGQVCDHGLEIEICGKRISTDDLRSFRQDGQPREGDPLYLPDGNLACLYLFGKADPSQVLRAVLEQRLQPLTRRALDEIKHDVYRVCRDRELTAAENSRLMRQLAWGHQRRLEQEETIWTLRAGTQNVGTFLNRINSDAARLEALLGVIPRRMRPPVVRRLLGNLATVRAKTERAERLNAGLPPILDASLTAASKDPGLITPR